MYQPVIINYPRNLYKSFDDGVEVRSVSLDISKAGMRDLFSN